MLKQVIFFSSLATRLFSIVGPPLLTYGKRDDNDELLITSDFSLDPNSLMPELSIAEDQTFRTGDRLSWVSRSRDGVLDEPPPRTAHIEFSGPVRV